MAAGLFFTGECPKWLLWAWYVSTQAGQAVWAGYALFQIPSNLLLVRFGAANWLAGAMAIWGMLSAMQALMRNAATFYVLRFMLGVVECGTFPGAARTCLLLRCCHQPWGAAAVVL